MLSFQVINDGKAIQVYCDRHGMAVLLEKLATLIRDPDHVHLLTPEAGGKDLEGTTPFGDPAVHEMIVDYDPCYEPENVG